MEKRYQVFVSSTYADLKEERQRVIQTLMELDCVPAGMELFPAADEDQFEFIKKVINDCDYYLLIVGGRYGSLTPLGISYTEQEYDYALSRGLKVIALLHENPDLIPFGKSEPEPEVRDKLRAFRNRVATGRLVRMWKSANELPGIVALSLSKTIKTFPAVGWVRADKIATEDVLTDLNALRRENNELKLEIASTQADQRPTLSNLAGLDETFKLTGRRTLEGRREDWSITATWRELFALIAPYLVKHPHEDIVKHVLSKAMFEKSKAFGYSAEIDDQVFQTITVQLRALGLVRVSYSQNTKGGMGLFWTATAAGEKLTFELRTVKTGA